MENYLERFTSRIDKINLKIAQLDKIKPVDEKQESDLANARSVLTKCKSEAKSNLRAYTDLLEKTRDVKRLEQAAAQETQQSQNENARHEKLKQFYGGKYPGSYDAANNTLDTSSWSSDDVANYAQSRYARNVAALSRTRAHSALKQAVEKRGAAAQAFDNIKQKIDKALPNNEDTTYPCIPCALAERNKKRDRIISAFPGQQSFGNCGIQSSNLLINLTTCKKIDETDLLKKALKDGDAEFVESSELSFSDWWDREFNPEKYAAHKNKCIDSIRPIRKLSDPVSAGNIGDPRTRKIDKDAEKENRKIISLDQTGGTHPYTREAIMRKQGVSSTQETPSVENIRQNLLDNKVMIFAAEASKLAPGYNEDGKEVETWVALEDKKNGKKKGEPFGIGGHAITVADGKFDCTGKLTDVLVNDTGCGKMYYMKIDDFMKSLRPNRNMNVSKDPIKTSCP